jgi:hypothetical protein
LAVARCETGLKYRIVRGCGHQHADPPHALALLRARRERPRRSRAAEQPDERAALHCPSRDLASIPASD